MQKLALFAGVTAMTVLMAPAGLSVADNGSTQHSVRITGHVPQVCYVEFDNTPTLSENGVYDFGNMKEFCNVPGGYQVIAEGGPGLAGAVMDVSGTPVTFDAHGSAVLVDSSEPAIITRSLLLHTAEPLHAGINIRIEAR